MAVSLIDALTHAGRLAEVQDRFYGEFPSADIEPDEGSAMMVRMAVTVAEAQDWVKNRSKRKAPIRTFLRVELHLARLVLLALEYGARRGLRIPEAVAFLLASEPEDQERRGRMSSAAAFDEGRGV